MTRPVVVVVGRLAMMMLIGLIDRHRSTASDRSIPSTSCVVSGSDAESTADISCQTDPTFVLTDLPSLSLLVSQLTAVVPDNSNSTELKPADVRSLSYSGRFGRIPAGSFRSFGQLRRLSIELAMSAFVGAESPISVAVDPGAFDGLTELEKLELIGVSMSSDGLPDAIGTLTALRQLFLDGCHINGQLRADSLRQLTSLDSLEILDSPALTVADDAFRHQASTLRRLTLTRVNVGKLPDSILDLQTLSELRISAKLAALPAKMLSKSAGSMTVIDLSENNISSVDSATFSGLLALSLLDLSDNAIETLPAGVFDDLSSLDTLILGANRLRNVDGLVKNLHYLQRYSLSGNRLENVGQATIAGAEASLTDLDLSGNRLGSARLGSLTVSPDVSLSANNISQLTESFLQKGSRFSNLDLGENPLRVVGPTVFAGVGVNTLTFDHTELTTFDLGWLSDATLVHTLELTENVELRSLVVGSSAKAPAGLRQIILDSNPKLVVTDPNGNLTAYLQQNGVQLYYRNSLLCHCQMRWMVDKWPKEIDRQRFVLLSDPDNGESSVARCCNNDQSADDFISKSQKNCSGAKAKAAITDKDVCLPYNN